MPRNPAETPQARKAYRNRHFAHEKRSRIHRSPDLRRSDDGLDRPPLPVLPARILAARAALHGNDHCSGRSARRPGAPLGLRFSKSTPWRCSWVASEPHDLAAAARIGEEAGYDEINLNCGCPSDRVASGAFGACLMLEPALVADCVAAMNAAVRVPVTVKMRVGVVSAKRAEVAQAAARRLTSTTMSALVHFIASVRAAGCQVAIVHARKAVLGGLSPKDNRAIPPLRYEVVRRLRARISDTAAGRERRTARRRPRYRRRCSGATG